ncbi:MAG: outer membrane lipoprotein-sorting protein [Alphaproteobacteria bacterium]|nr:outer membrane lipoprotein-sorting protein [Alphaproteobacteria bacterium]
MRRIFYSTLTLLALAGPAAHAETPEERGLAIAQEADRRNQGWVDSKVDLRMILRNAQGESSERSMKLRALEVISDTEGDKSLTYFLSPADVEGTALLSFTRITEADDQWLYLPALKRVKRIASANKSGSFVGSEFAFEDLLAQEVGRFTYKFLREEPCPTEESKGLTCFVSERFPVYENSGYTKQISWVDSAEYRVWQLDLYDRKEEHSKTLTFSDYRQYQDKFWRAHTLDMVNLQSNKSTTLAFGDYSLNAGVDQSEFDADALSRLR